MNSLVASNSKHGNSLFMKIGESCSNCGHPFYYSFVSFDYLPLVEFVIDSSLSQKDIQNIVNRANINVSNTDIMV